MSPALRALVILSATLTFGGVLYVSYVPTPPDVKNAQLKQAGLQDGELVVQVCPTRLAPSTIAIINKTQPGQLRPGQGYARLGRVAFCFSFDGGACMDANGLPLRSGEMVVPSLRQALPDSGLALDGGEEDIDTGLNFSEGQCRLIPCDAFRVDAGLPANWCNANQAVNRVALVPAPCMMPNGWSRGADGGWCEETSCLDTSSPTGYRPCAAGDTCGEVDCRFQGVLGLADGGPRWRGFNTGPRELASGTACVPTECGVVSGDVPAEWL